MPKKYRPAGVAMTPSKTELGKFIRDRRMELDLRQIPVSQAAGLSEGSNLLSMIEIGVRKYLNPKQVEGLAKVLRIDPEELRKRMPEKHVAKPRTELGKLIRARREELGMTLEGLAKKLRITPRQAKRLEIRKSPSLRYPLAEPLAKALKLDVSAFAKFVGRKGKVTGGELGQLIRQRRKELAMSLTALAKKLRVSRQYIDQIESGQCRLSESDEMIERLAEVLKLDVAQLNAIRPRRKLRESGFTSERTTPLGEFVTTRRLELRLTQREVSNRAGTYQQVISAVERGTYRVGRTMLERISKALACEIPAELVLEKKRAEECIGSTSMVQVSGRALDDLNKIKELADVKSNSEIVRKAIQLLRRLLEKQQDDYVVSVLKGEDVVKFDILL